MHSKRWQINPPLTPIADEALRAFHSILRQILFNRGYPTFIEAQNYLAARLPFDTSPWQLTGIRPAIERLKYAIDHTEAVSIYGDYDVDGVTATALLVETLQALGANVHGYIPNRFDEGYGLNQDALESLAAQGVKVVVTVDCGIRSPSEVAHARAVGLDLIITDHHQPSGELPPAYAIINPKQPGDMYPDKDLAGVGIAYKIAEAMLEKRPSDRLIPEDLLDLVALGTVADLVPLTGENRSLVRKGLQRIRETQRQGLFSLAYVAGLEIKRTTATNIGYILGPRLNAAGRLDTAEDALELLMTTDVSIAGNLAQQLNAQNRTRQELTRSMQEQAEAIISTKDPGALVLFAIDPGFNTGVVGLVASRLTDSFYRPAIVGQRSDETTRCSCRSIPEFHITQALDQCADLLIRHGGHAAAAGFTVRNDNFDELVTRMQRIASEQLAGHDLRPTLMADAEVSLSDLKPQLLDYLELLQPTGYGNPEAVFVSRKLRIKNSRTVGADGQHLKLTVTDGKLTFDAIAFRLGSLQQELPTYVDLLFTFEVNEYNGRKSLQLNIRDLKPSSGLD